VLAALKDKSRIIDFLQQSAAAYRKRTQSVIRIYLMPPPSYTGISRLPRARILSKRYSLRGNAFNADTLTCEHLRLDKR
jgi:hypothetical protein